MDGQRFDALMRALSDRGSRRRLLSRLLAGTGLATMVGAGRVAPPVAGVDLDRRCGNRPAVSNTRCTEKLCFERSDQVCSCARIVRGGIRCVDITNEECPTTDECDRNEDCGGNQVCIEVGGCCEGSPRNLCVRPCVPNRAATSATSTARAPLLGRS